MSDQYVLKKPKPEEQDEKTSNESLLDNILRILKMLDNALKRLERHNYFSKSQCPIIFLHTEEYIKNIREWIQAYKMYSSLQNFYGPIGILFEQLQILFDELISTVTPLNGKRQMKMSRRIKERKKIIGSISHMLNHIDEYLQLPKENDRLIEERLEDSLIEAFMKFWKQKATEEAKYLHLSEYEKEKNLLSQRGEKSYIFPCKAHEDYFPLINDKSRFRREIVDLLDEYPHATGHKSTCKGHKKYNMAGFRPKPRKVWLIGGKQWSFPIRMVKCLNCGEKFSLLPSFLPREKHSEIEIIGNAVRNLLLFGQSFRAVLENLKTIVRGKVKSKQTIFNWLRWIGIFHPAAILTRAGIAASGYLQEDEGFEKEPSLRTYSVVMVDAKYL